MKKYDFLKTMSIEKLIALKEVTTDELLKDNIEVVLGSNKDDFSRELYSSDRSTYITPELDDDYKRLINNLKISDLKFFYDLACTGLGNNAGYQSSISDINEMSLVYGYPNVKELLAEYGVNRYWKYRNMCFDCVPVKGYLRESNYSEEFKIFEEINKQELIKKAKEETQYFRGLDSFFSCDENKVLYEGTYNAYMYMKDYLYHVLSEDNNISLDNILMSHKEKVVIVKRYIQDIAEYLYFLKSRITDSRLAVFNNKIRFIVKKRPSKFSDQQQQFAELVAFGISKENLEKKDYKEMERLIYIPKNKI